MHAVYPGKRGLAQRWRLSTPRNMPVTLLRPSDAGLPCACYGLPCDRFSGVMIGICRLRRQSEPTPRPPVCCQHHRMVMRWQIRQGANSLRTPHVDNSAAICRSRESSITYRFGRDDRLDISSSDDASMPMDAVEEVIR